MMAYRAIIIAAIKANKDETPNGTKSFTINKYVKAHIPAKERWNFQSFLNQIKKMERRGELVRFKSTIFKFSADFEKKLLNEKDVADTRRDKLTDETTATKARERARIIKVVENSAAVKRRLVVTRWNYVRGSITSFTTSLKDPIFSKVLLHAWASWKRRTGYTRSVGSYTDGKPNFGTTGTHFRRVVKIVELIRPILTNDITVFCQN